MESHDPPPSSQYRRAAPRYDEWTAEAEPLRREAVQRLALQRGDSVVDVGCGTGLNFRQVELEIGPRGRLLGIDASPEMLARARARVAHRRWRNVTLIEAAAERAEIPFEVDAVLLSWVHDVMRSSSALEHILGRAKPGARVVALGPKAPPWWASGLKVPLYLATRPYVSTVEGLGEPWSHLARLVPDLRVDPRWFEGAYLASGTVGRPDVARP